MGRWVLALAGAAAFACGTASAQPFPSKPVRVVVGFAAGGPADVMARLIAQRMPQILGQPFIIENRPGAGGNIAAEQVARSAPDGLTLLMGNNSILATNAALYKKINFDPEKDFIPISLIGTQANILVVNPKVQANTMAELIDLAKKNPGKMNFASSGHGAAAHLSGELFKSEAKVDIVHVAYKGAAPALQDVIAGHVDMMFATAASVVGHIRSGQVRALAVTTPKRTAVMPEIATIDELGLKGFDATTWHGLVVPAGTSKEIIAVLYDATKKTLADPGVQKQLGDLGVVHQAQPEAIGGGL